MGALMGEIEKRTSLVDLTKYTKEVAAQGNFSVAATLRNAADELSFLREEIVKLRGTIREIKSIANLSIRGRI